MLTVVNKTKKGESYILSSNIDKLFLFLYLTMFYIAGYMETFIVCIIIIVLTIVFAILGCKLSSKLELKSQYEKSVPDNLKPATEEEKDLLRQHFTMVGTIDGGKYAKNLVEEWCQSLYVAYGIVVDARTSGTLGESDAYDVRYATVQINELKFEITLDNAVIGNSVIVFYGKDDKEQMVYRFAIRKESKNVN